jgi:hypothetical protein
VSDLLTNTFRVLDLAESLSQWVWTMIHHPEGDNTRSLEFIQDQIEELVTAAGEADESAREAQRRVFSYYDYLREKRPPSEASSDE